MTDDKKAQVRLLHDQGLGYRKIAKQLGVGKNAVARVLNPDGAVATNLRRRAAKEEWAREHYRGRCYCGAVTSDRGTKRCRSCDTATRRELHDLKLDVVEAMYQEGWPIAEMSAAFGYKTPNGVAMLIAELHKAGRIGYRRNFKTRR